MRKLIISLSVVLCGFSYVCAMDLAPRIIEKKEHIPLQKNLENDYSRDTHGYRYLMMDIVRLPVELQRKIFAKRYEVNESKIFTISPEKILEEFCVLQKLCPLQIGNKTFSAAQLLEIPREEREILIGIACPSFVKKIAGSSCNTLTKDDRDELISILAEYDLQDGLIIQTLPNTEEVYPNVCGMHAAHRFAIAPLAGGCVSLLLFLGLCFSPLDSGASAGISAGVFSVITLGGTAGAYYHHRKLLTDNAQQLQWGSGT